MDNLYKPPPENKKMTLLLVGLVTLLQVVSYYLGYNKTNSAQHTVFVILAWALVTPFIMRFSKDTYGLTAQIVVAVLVTVLDWFSFHEDMSRFSEEELCIFGNCRYNAQITGILAHVADVVTLIFLIPETVDTDMEKIVVVGLLVAYGVIGSLFIDSMTVEGSVSDLRGKTDQEKCLQSRIMRDGWRGALNDVICVLGVIATWQALFPCKFQRCDSSIFPFSMIPGVFDGYDGGKQGSLYLVNILKILFLDIGLAIFPNYANYINTTFQHGGGAEKYKLPKCFDDPEKYN